MFATAYIIYKHSPLPTYKHNAVKSKKKKDYIMLVEPFSDSWKFPRCVTVKMIVESRYQRFNIRVSITCGNIICSYKLHFTEKWIYIYFFD